MEFKLEIAKSAGFCFGVQRSVDIATELSKKSAVVKTYGPLIHNEEVLRQLKADGVVCCNNVEDFTENDIVVIRAHGISDNEKEKLRKSGAEIYDATCPFVEKIHSIVRDQSTKAEQVLIIGAADHPEVMGIAGCAENTSVFADLEELKRFTQSQGDVAKKHTAVVAQTTLNVEEYQKIKEFLKKNYTSTKIFDTICSATLKRQCEAEELAKKSAVFIVLGSKNSSNTVKLYEIGRAFCEHAYLVGRASELPLDEIRQALQSGGCKTVGLTAGASTPAHIIKEAIKTMDELRNTENFEELLEQSLITLNTGDRVRGTVIGFASNHDVMVDLGTKQAAYIPAAEATTGNSNPEDVFNVGDEVEVCVTRVNDVDGVITLSKKRVDSIKGQEEIAKAAEDKTVLTGTFSDVVKGGAIILYNGVRVFIPASQCPVKKDEDLSVLKGQETRFVIIEFDRRRNKIVGSVRDVLRNERRQALEKFWETAEVGKKYKGVVKSLTNYGAFVDLGGIDGMIHISELAWSKIKHPSIVVKVGDEVEVVIKELDREKNRIALGYKELSENPWNILAEKYHVGDVVNVTIARLAPFGAFAEVIPGIDGLIHISQIANKKIERPSAELSVGQKVDAKIVGIDIENQKLSLSIRALLAPEEEEKAEEPATEEAQAE